MDKIIENNYLETLILKDKEIDKLKDTIHRRNLQIKNLEKVNKELNIKLGHCIDISKVNMAIDYFDKFDLGKRNANDVLRELKVYINR